MKKGILVLLMVGSAAHAGLPVWRFTPIGSPVISVSATGTASVSYTVTNNSKKPHQLVLSSNTPAGISQVGGACGLAGLGSTCTLTLNINGSALPSDNVSGGPILCNGTPNINQCYQPSPGDSLVITRTYGPILTASVSQLALSVTGLTEYGVPERGATTPSGLPRQITITNTGATAATGLNISYPSWPTGTSATSTCGSSLAAGGTCTITVTPGANATSDCNTSHSSPTSSVITVSATNVATPVTTNVLVLGYSCQYRGGYVYAFDDTTPITGSVGGKVVTITDQKPPSSGCIWSSDGRGTTVSDIAILGIDQLSTSNSPSPTSPAYSAGTPAYRACNGESDGACDTSNIVSYYNFNRTAGGSAPTPLTQYASGFCKATINGYSDWYLPAICEMGYSKNGYPSSCGTSNNPTLQNIQQSLIDNSGLSTLAGYYWSSTELYDNPSQRAWAQVFRNSDSSFHYAYFKSNSFGVRCSRVF